MWDKVLVATLTWILTVYKFNTMRRNGQWHTGSVANYFWLFLLFTSIGLTLMIWPVYLIFNQLVGLNNFGWLIIYLSLALALYFISLGCYQVIKQSPPRLMSWCLIITLILLVVVYAAGIHTLPEKPDHTIPETLTEVAFMEILYLFMAILCAVPLVTFIRLARREQIVSTWLRWLVAFFASFFSFSVLVIKIVLTLLTYQNPETPVLAVIYPLISSGILVVALFMTLAFLPNRFYQITSRPFIFLSKLLTLCELKLLQKWLNSLCPPIVTGRLHPGDMVNDLDYHLYRTLIAIWDAKKTLSDYYELTDGLTRLPKIDVQHTGYSLTKWDEHKLQQARTMYHALQTVDDNQSFEFLVKAYQRTCRSLLGCFGWKGISLSPGGSQFDAAYQS